MGGSAERRRVIYGTFVQAVTSVKIWMRYCACFVTCFKLTKSVVPMSKVAKPYVLPARLTGLFRLFMIAIRHHSRMSPTLWSFIFISLTETRLPEPPCIRHRDNASVWRTPPRIHKLEWRHLFVDTSTIQVIFLHALSNAPCNGTSDQLWRSEFDPLQVMKNINGRTLLIRVELCNPLSLAKICTSLIVKLFATVYRKNDRLLNIMTLGGHMSRWLG